MHVNEWQNLAFLAAVAVCASALMGLCIDFTIKIKYTLFREYLKLRGLCCGSVRIHFLLICL